MLRLPMRVYTFLPHFLIKDLTRPSLPPGRAAPPRSGNFFPSLFVLDITFLFLSSPLGLFSEVVPPPGIFLWRRDRGRGDAYRLPCFAGLLPYSVSFRVEPLKHNRAATSGSAFFFRELAEPPVAIQVEEAARR